ncbi:MAG: hypothetical protein ACKPAF_08955 [Actinomycetota bacterium]
MQRMTHHFNKFQPTTKCINEWTRHGENAVGRDVVGDIFPVNRAGDFFAIFAEQPSKKPKRCGMKSRPGFISPTQIYLATDQVVILVSPRDQLQQSRGRILAHCPEVRSCAQIVVVGVVFEVLYSIKPTDQSAHQLLARTPKAVDNDDVV